MKYRRGIKADKDLFGSLLEREERSKKGRDAKLVEERNVYLYHLSYYYRHLLGIPYEYAMLDLQKRLFISVDTIPRILDEYTVEIKRLMNENVTVEQLRGKYPDDTWNREPYKEFVKRRY